MSPTTTRQRYTLSQPLHAVKLNPIEESTFEQAGIVTLIPADSTLEIDETIRIKGMLSVKWQGELYAVFADDLLARAVQAC